MRNGPSDERRILDGADGLNRHGALTTFRVFSRSMGSRVTGRHQRSAARGVVSLICPIGASP